MTEMTRFTLLFSLLSVALPLGAFAQGNAPKREAPPAVYDSQGRRDPFRPTIGEDKGSGDRCAQREGMAGVLLQEVRLTGIVMTPKGPMAMWEGGPANQGYFSYEGDEFCDGTVHSINYDNKVAVVRQIKEDPKRKLLRPWLDVPRHLHPEDATESPDGVAFTSGGRKSALSGIPSRLRRQ